MAYNEDSSASGHDEPWIQWYEEQVFLWSPLSIHDEPIFAFHFYLIAYTIAALSFLLSRL